MTLPTQLPCLPYYPFSNRKMTLFWRKCHELQPFSIATKKGDPIFWGIFFRLSFRIFFRVSVSRLWSRKEGRKEARKQGRKQWWKGSKEGSKKKAKKLDELGVSHFYFQVFPFLQPFLFQIWFFSFWARYFQFLLVPLSLCVWFAAFAPSCDCHTSRCSLWLSHPWFLIGWRLQRQPQHLGGRRCALPPNPRPALLDF